MKKRSRTEEDALATVREHGSALQFVPEDLQTPAMRLVAVQSRGMALEAMRQQSMDIVGVQVVGNTYDDIGAFRVSYALSKILPPLYADGRFPNFRNEK